jgi:L-ribulose-5-phosphate 3-epimerase
VIGEGQVDFPVIFKTLVEIDYASPLVIETWSQNEQWSENIVNAKKNYALW